MEFFCRIIMYIYQKLLLSELEVSLTCQGKGFTAVSSVSTDHVERPQCFTLTLLRCFCAQPMGSHKLSSISCPSSLTISA